MGTFGSMISYIEEAVALCILMFVLNTSVVHPRSMCVLHEKKNQEFCMFFFCNVDHILSIYITEIIFYISRNDFI